MVDRSVEYFIGNKTPMGGAYLGNIYDAYIKAMVDLNVFGSTDEVTNLKIAAITTELEEVKRQLNEVVVRLNRPIGSTDLRTATLEEVLLQMKNDSTLVIDNP